MEQKDQFYKLLDDHIEGLNGKFQNKFCITQQVYDDIKAVLSLDKGQKCDSGSYFKFWCRKNYRLEKIGTLSVVYCVKSFTGEEMVSMNNVHFPELVSIDPSDLEEVLIVQASRQSTNWQASKKHHDVCQCKGSCINNRCCCRKKGVKCSTKCHVGSMVCQNKI